MSVNLFKQFKHNLIESDINLSEVQKDGKRFYSTPDGEFPSVTTVVGYGKQQFFAEWRRKNPEESRRVTSRGTKFHSIIETYIRNEPLDMENMFPNFKALFNLIKPALDNIDNIVAIETPLWSKILGLAGRTDCIAEYNGKLSIIDFKASTKEKRKQDIENYFLQATAYALMYQERTGVIVENFVILIACEDGLFQVFEDTPIKYVKKLKQSIIKYREENGIH
jgi:CRISPR/Cas system-associated exonuclease Cas4 (RecB family)